MNTPMKKNALIFFVLSFTLSGCTFVSEPPDITGIKRINKEEAEQCQSLGEEIRDSKAHSFYHDDNMIKLLDRAKVKAVKLGGNAFLVKSMKMSYEHNSAKIVYQVFSCSE